MPIKNQVQLITYPDSLGGNLRTLNRLLISHFTDIFPGGVHILPPFPSTGDRGFAPRTYFEIDPGFGGWEDVKCISEHFPILLDVMVNHISRQSSYFQDFMKKGRKSKYADLFITLDKIWPGGKPAQEDVSRIFLRRPVPPFADVPIEETGVVEKVWATFGSRDWSEQIDLDVNSPVTRKLFTDILHHMSKNGVKMLRLDAVAFVTKKPGTSCFFVEPDIYSFLNWIKQVAGQVGIDLLPEVHASFSIQNRLAEHGFYVYNFILPSLILHTLFNKSSSILQAQLKVCPRNQFTMLDCHDGIPIQPDVGGILEIDEAQKIVQICIERGANINRILSTQHMSRPDFDAHQINCTYYSALNEDNNAYIAARAIQFFTPGIPQVYYVGLLAGVNDHVEVEKSGENRAINRHNYTVDEVEQALEKPVVQRLLNLIRFRNEYAAFTGEFEVLDSDDCHLRLSWCKGEKQCLLTVNLDTCISMITYRDSAGAIQQYKP